MVQVAASSALSQWKALGYAAVVTAIAGASSHLLPDDWSASVVGATFFISTYWLVLRDDPVSIREHGLSLGGLFEPVPLSPRRIARATSRSFVWAVALALIVLPPFAFGYWWWWKPTRGLALSWPESPFNEVATQILAVALPEEMFYRGYLQTELERPASDGTVAGKTSALAIVVTSLVFALGHVVTVPEPARLMVFFPSLLFGWLRSRSGGIGASVLFHALCNLFALYLGRGYGFFS